MERRDFINNMIIAGLGSAVLPLSSFTSQPTAKCDFISMVKTSPHVRHGALYIPTVLDKPAPIFGAWLSSIEHHTFHKQGIDTGSAQDDMQCYMAILGDHQHQESIQVWNEGGKYTLVSAGATQDLSSHESRILIGENTFAFRLNHSNSLLSQSIKLNEDSRDGEIVIVLEGQVEFDGQKCGANEIIAVRENVKTIEMTGNTVLLSMREV